MENITLGQIAAALAFLVALIGSIRYIAKEIAKPFNDIHKDIKDIKDELAVVKKSQRDGTRSTILKSCQDYIKAGYITLEQLETLSESYDSYIALGGKNTVNHLYEQASHLPIRSN